MVFLCQGHKYWKRGLAVLKRLMGMIGQWAGKRATQVSNTLELSVYCPHF